MGGDPTYCAGREAAALEARAALGFMNQERDNGDEQPDDQRISIGRIPLKQMRVSKQAQARNPMNLLVPYLDLFARLADDELSRLAGVGEDVVASLRQQVVTIDEALGAYADLLPRLTDTELVRLTGATEKTVRFWRLCQPRGVPPASDSGSEARGVVARRAKAKASTGPVAAPEAEAARTATEGKKRSDEGGHEAPPRREPAAFERSVASPAPPSPPSSGHASPSASVQQAASRLMTFSGDPFPGFDDSAAGFEGVPSPDEAEVALRDIEQT